MSSRRRKKTTNPSDPAANPGSSAEAEAALDAGHDCVPGAPDTLDIDDSRASGEDERVWAAGGMDATEEVTAVSEISQLRPRDPRLDDAESNSALDEVPGAELDEELPVDAESTAPPATRAHLKRLIESLIFVSDQIISPVQIGRIVKAKQAEVRDLVAELSAEYEGRGIELVEVGGGYQFRSAAASAPFVRDLVSQRPVRLTRAQLETLALIAYRQPITRPEIDDVRGVDSGSAIKVLLDRGLVKILGRKDEAGRPLLYGTAPFFLEFFGMKGMQDLPTLREFTELNAEHRELFQRKTGEIPDLSSDTHTAGSVSPAYVDPEDELPPSPDDEAPAAATDVVDDGQATAFSEELGESAQAASDSSADDDAEPPPVEAEVGPEIENASFEPDGPISDIELEDDDTDD